MRIIGTGLTRQPHIMNAIAGRAAIVRPLGPLLDRTHAFPDRNGQTQRPRAHNALKIIRFKSIKMQPNKNVENVENASSETLCKITNEKCTENCKLQHAKWLQLERGQGRLHAFDPTVAPHVSTRMRVCV